MTKAAMITHTHTYTHSVIVLMLDVSIYDVNCKELTFNLVQAAR